MREKFLSMLVSFKVYTCVASTILLCYDKINEQTWSTIIVALVAGRVVTQSVSKYKGIKLEELEK